MRVYKNIASATQLTSPVVSIGFFDGVHKGHRFLLNKLISEAQNRNSDHLLISMCPHPLSVAGDKKLENFMLNTQIEKLQHFEKLGIQHLLILDFTKYMAGVSSENFVKNVLKSDLGVSALLMGFNNSFGKKDSTADFQQIANSNNIELIRANAYSDIKISSSIIRELIINGKVSEASKYLGYYYSWTGIVVDGYKIGRTLGFPTANLETENNEKVLPIDGVYLAHAVIGEEKYHALVNIGNRPTFNGDKKSVELHILDFNKDIYNQKCRVEFVDKLRNEKHFPNADELKNQLKKDLAFAKKFFKL